MSLQTAADPLLAGVSANMRGPRARYAWYVLGVLTLIYVFSIIDRSVVALLVEPIRRQFSITDTQISVLMGVSFALFFCLFGIPLGRLADSHSRRGLIAGGFVLWSAMTAGCALAKTYGQFVLLRVGVGVGEASLTPAAYSLITDYFPKEKLGTAMSVYSLAIHIGAGLAFIFDGLVVAYVAQHTGGKLPWLGAIQPWQSVFLILGLSGIALALLMYTVKEPARKLPQRMPEGAVRTRSVSLPLREVWKYFRRNKATLICHNLGFTLTALTSYTTWGPSIFIRNFGWSAGKAGAIYGVLTSVLGAVGILAGGRFADYLARRGYRDANMRLGLIVTLAWFPTGLLFPLMPNATWAIAMLIPSYLFVSAPWGAAAAALQQVMPDSMRGQATGIYLLVLNLVSTGLGPMAVALLTDYAFHNDHAVNLSMLIVGASSHALAALLLWKGLGYFRASLARMPQWQAANE